MNDFFSEIHKSLSDSGQNRPVILKVEQTQV